MKVFSVLVLLSGGWLLTQSPSISDSSSDVNAPARDRLRAVYTGELGVREATGRNDGTRVELFLHYTHLKPGNPWCAAFVCWCLGQAGIPNPRTGYCPNLFPKNKVIWTRSTGIGGASSRNSQLTTRNPPRTPLPGDIFGIYFPEKGRIAHVGFVDQWDGKWLITVEGNTNESGSREGDGVYRKRRLVSSISKVSAV
ncbi:CHAP domain-containing protein, partial [Pararcticibacter amylolyticus]